MEGAYYRDFREISLADYSVELEQTGMIPSRKILKENISGRFRCLQDHGITNLNDLLVALKTPDKLRSFAKMSGLPEEYLVILKREIGSIQPKPVNLEDFPSLFPGDTGKLAGLGIRNTRQLFEVVRNESQRRELETKTGIPQDRILELTRLTDVSRIKWVGANFARLLVDSGYDTVEKVAGADSQVLYSAVNAVNEEKKYFKGKFGLNDMKLCVLAARTVPKGIHFP